MDNKSQFIAHLIMKNGRVTEKFQSEEPYKTEKSALKHIDEWLQKLAMYEPIISWIEEKSGDDFKVVHLTAYYGAMNISDIHYVK